MTFFSSSRSLVAAILVSASAARLLAAANGLQDVGTAAFTDAGANVTSAEYIISGSVALDQDTAASSGRGAYLTTSSTNEHTITVTPNNITVGAFELTAIMF